MFERVKAMLVLAPAFAYYDTNCNTVISADASSYGLGAALLQEHDDELKPLAYCSGTHQMQRKDTRKIKIECLAGVTM